MNERLYEISDLDIIEITLTKSPAIPEASFLLAKSSVKKSRDKQLFLKSYYKGQSANSMMPFIKADIGEQILWAYVLIPDKADLQGDSISKEEIKKARNRFMKNLSEGNIKKSAVGWEHQKWDKTFGYPVESFIDYDGKYFDNGIPGAWAVGIKLGDEMWERYLSGNIKGFSIGGFYRKQQIEKNKSQLSKCLNISKKLIKNKRAKVVL